MVVIRTSFNRLAAAGRGSGSVASGRAGFNARGLEAKLRNVEVRALRDPSRAEFYRGLVTTLASDAYVQGGYRYTPAQRRAIDKAYQTITATQRRPPRHHATQGMRKANMNYMPMYAAPLRGGGAGYVAGPRPATRRLNRSSAITRTPARTAARTPARTTARTTAYTGRRDMFRSWFRG